jgi:hypothetical protein
MKEHRMTLLMGLLGVVTSLTLLLAIAFSELKNRETLTTKLKQVEESSAAELKPTPTPAILQKNPDDLLNSIDKIFNSEPVMQNITEEQ